VGKSNTFAGSGKRVGECGDINYYYWSRKEKELFNWLKLTWTQDTCPVVVLRTYCMPGTSNKGRNKKWTSLERYMKKIEHWTDRECDLDNSMAEVKNNTNSNE